MYVIANRIAYDVFAGRRVTDHLMVIPKRHTESINDFTDQEKIDQMTIMGDYESRGYDVYARGVESVTRSVKHQHTHLIKMLDKRPKLVIFSERPHILINV
jgi:diadenosine tetraphosphate (Ap4A) HIT family hydrolase